MKTPARRERVGDEAPETLTSRDSRTTRQPSRIARGKA